jgi:hypothetical protein
MPPSFVVTLAQAGGEPLQSATKIAARDDRQVGPEDLLATGAGEPIGACSKDLKPSWDGRGASAPAKWT